jgi:uncharacterized glyoxalase superfamily protein PhnB
MPTKPKVKAIPDGYHTVTPYLTVEGADKLIRFLKKAFDAEPLIRVDRPDGKIGHAQVRIGDSAVMISEPFGACTAVPATFYLYVKDADATYNRALKAGGTSVMQPTDMFYGDRYAAVKDHAGNTWGIATHIADVSPAELKKGVAACMAEQPAAR